MAGVTSSTQDRLAARSAALVQRLTGYHGDGKDVTDPRELYAILSQADAKRHKRCINVPILVCDSMLQQKVNHEIKIKIQNDESEQRPQTPLTLRQNSLDLHDSNSVGLPALQLVRQTSSLEDLRTLKRKEHDKNGRVDIPGFLPWLNERVVRVAFGESPNDGGCTVGDIIDPTDIVLPRVPKVLEKTLPITKQACSSPNPDKELESGEPDNLVDPRLAGVPEEFIVRTQQILMEETFRERLRARGLGLHRNRNLFPPDNSRATDLKAYDLYPGQYWELRSETVPQPNNLTTDMIDRGLYRMKQKSLLQLKVMDCEAKVKGGRTQGNANPSHVQRFPPRQPKSRPSMLESLLPEQQDDVGLSPFTKLMLGPVVAESVPAPLQEPEALVDPPNPKKGDNHRFPYLLSEEPLKDDLSQYQRHTQYNLYETPRLKYIPPTSVVNLTIEQKTPRQRKPRHIEANIKRQEKIKKHSHQLNPLESYSGLHSVGARSQTTNDIVPTSGANAHEPPTDEAQHTKATLTGFKKLEPFAEMKPLPKGNSTSMSFKDVPNHRYMPQCHPQLYKLDLRNYPPEGNMLHVFELAPGHHHLPGNNPLSLRLIDGGVIVSKVAEGNQPHTSRTVKSDAVSSEQDSPWPVMSKS